MAKLSAGWYPNPDKPSELRWWTGTQWGAPATPPPPPPPAARRRSRPRLPVLALGGIGLLALIGLIQAGVGGLQSGPGSQPQTLVDTVQTSEPSPEVTTRREQTTAVVPYDSIAVDDPTRDVGDDAITTAGVAGEETTIWLVTLTDGVETDREQISVTVTTPPVTEVTWIGTRVPPPPKPAKSNCDPNYSGACVPIASDVDCAGGNGNGPAYVSGPVRVVGRDIYQLDRDGDGIACD